jgi:predicted glycosyltransferase
MRILVDIVHMADVNFYKNIASKLSKKHKITFTVLDRGKLLEIMKKEYPNYRIIPLGKHRKGLFSKLFGIIDREIGFIKLFAKEKFDRVSAFGFYPAIAAKLFGIRSVLAYDDYEYKMNFNLCRLFADVFIIPSSLDAHGNNTIDYDGLKECAYLNNFKPDKKALKEFGLEEKKYVFIRDIGSISLNYKNERINLDNAITMLQKNGLKVVYYGEEKQKESCLNATEPIPKIHSLLYYSRFCISSGDTIAREAGILGKYAIYTGKRKMRANSALESAGIIISVNTEKELISTAEDLINKKENAKKKAFADPTIIMVRELEK